MKRKLFSTKQKQDLANLKIHYHYNRARKDHGAIYSLQAAQFAKELLGLFTQVASTAEDDADVVEICERVFDNMRVEVKLSANTFEGKHEQLMSWLEKQSEATNTKLARLLRVKRV